jgi:hypothetical protein
MIRFRALPGRRRQLALLLFAVAWTSQALAALPASTRWADPSSVRLDIEFPGQGYHATWNLYRCDCGDLLIRSELSAPGEVESGESMLVGGRVVLSRGFGEADEPLLGDSLDAPALMMQLVLSLLERVAPAGPSTVTGTAEVRFEEPLTPIHLDSGGASGTFWAPWSVDGSVEAVTESKRRFDFQFRFSTGNPGEELIGSMRLWGESEYAQGEFPVAPASPLGDWKMSWRDEADPALTASADVRTVEALRKLLQMTR